MLNGYPSQDVGALVSVVLNSKQWQNYAKNNKEQRVVRLVACKSGAGKGKVGWAKDFKRIFNEQLKKETKAQVKAPEKAVTFVNSEMSEGFRNVPELCCLA